VEAVRLSQHDKDNLRLGQPPRDQELLDAITVGEEIWVKFFIDQYLGPEGYIGNGGSQVKFIIGKPGAGKTHLLRQLAVKATEMGYVSVLLSAKDIRLQHIDNIYAAIAAQVNTNLLASLLAQRVAIELGYDLNDVPGEDNLVSWACEHHGRIPQRIIRDIEEILGKQFKRERVEPNFSLAFIQLASEILGARSMSSHDRGSINRWLRGERLRAGELHPINLSRNIDRYNARDMFRALAEFIRQQGFKGLFVCVDDMEDLALGVNAETGRRKYGGAALADVYQSMRELVDDGPFIAGSILLFAGRPEFLEPPRGIKSYDALWLRIQHEVISPLFNKFSQVIDLDRCLSFNFNILLARLLFQRLISLGLAGHFDEQAIKIIIDNPSEEGMYRRLIKAMLSSLES